MGGGGDADKADRADEADKDDDDRDIAGRGAWRIYRHAGGTATRPTEPAKPTKTTTTETSRGGGTGGIYKHACSFAPFEIMPSSSYKHTSWLVPTPHNLPWNKKLYFAPHDMPHRNYVQGRGCWGREGLRRDVGGGRDLSDVEVCVWVSVRVCVCVWGCVWACGHVHRA